MNVSEVVQYWLESAEDDWPPVVDHLIALTKDVSNWCASRPTIWRPATLRIVHRCESVIPGNIPRRKLTLFGRLDHG